jgi:hypothetical protein
VEDLPAHLNDIKTRDLKDLVQLVQTVESNVAVELLRGRPILIDKRPLGVHRAGHVIEFNFL